MARPGKFEGQDNITDYLYDLSLDGTDKDLGDVQDFGWYGLMLNVPVENVKGWKNGEIVNAILGEDSQGFVDSKLFDTKEEAQEAWDDLETEYADFATESGEE